MPDTYNSKYTAAQIESFFDLLNSNSFITNTVSNLVNYYLKTELYTKTEIDTIVANIKNSRFESVSVLPTENIKTNVIYLLPASSSKTNNIKDEYINLDGTTGGWEKIGSTSVDLSNYVTLQALNNALANYVTSSDLTTALENFTPSEQGTDDYSDLDNKPSIENVTLDGNKSASDLGLAKSSDLVNKQDKIQVTTMPEASIDLLNKVIQYIGVTTQDYIHNYYYECISDGESTPSYSWQQTNVQPSSSSESSNGGHTIENSEGTDLIQRDTLQFGEGFKAEDDSTNEKTVISPNVMQSGDMDDVVTPLPSVQSRYHRYSTEEQIVGTWIDGSTLYEKVISGLAMPQVTTTSEILKYNLSSYGVPSDATVVAYDAYIANGDNVYKRCHFANAVDVDYSIMQFNSWFTNDPTTGRQFAVRNNKSTYNDYLITVIVQYTKTT